VLADLHEVQAGCSYCRLGIDNLKNGHVVAALLKPTAQRSQRIEVAGPRKTQDAQTNHFCISRPNDVAIPYLCLLI
jgi:hypothetical protein